MTDLLTKLAYQTMQQGKGYVGLAHKAISTQLFNWVVPPSEAQKLALKTITPDLLQQIQSRMAALLEEDWQDVERGIYPSEILFDNPWDSFLKVYPWVWLDSPRTWVRSRDSRTKEFSPDIETEGYPRYYLRNFHHQTDGYLSDGSAQIYDLQVELLFNGTADAMRRRILAPLRSGLQRFDLPQRQLRGLDIACGTGRTLKMLRGCFAQAKLFGVDLSGAYLRKANELLSQEPNELPQLVEANAEALPYQDNYFHGTSCVFLFHELPGPVRQRVIQEAFRVTQPGGTFVICDSIQAIDMGDLRPIMENFQATFHEPFYCDYIQDNLEARLAKAGFETVEVFSYFMSKYWVARKPV
ncbi:MAG: class I SAM-dependent methyltransferase [Synechococcales cyanobacterium RM1_1_8]|nr:class I SAM-dependent methyltransferase [Synechococcales cyanobacterium RM1_1_8]